MKLPAPFIAQENIKQITSLTDRVLLDINGTPAWVGNYAYGMCLAIDTGLQNINTKWLMHVCLWLASKCSFTDDSLILESSRLYLLRHYSKELNHQQYKKLIYQQTKLVKWLFKHYTNTILTDN